MATGTPAQRPVKGKSGRQKGGKAPRSGGKQGPQTGTAARTKQPQGDERPYHHGNLREALVEGAVALMAEEGVHNLSLRRVAARVGVTAGAPYRHFARREELLAAIAEDGFERLIRSVERAQRTARSARGRYSHRRLLLDSAVAYVDFAVANPDYLRLMFGSEIAERGAYPTLEDASRRSFGQLLQLTEDLRQAGFLARRTSAETAALTVWSILHGLSMLFIEAQLPQARSRAKKLRLTRSLVSAALRGLR